MWPAMVAKINKGQPLLEHEQNVLLERLQANNVEQWIVNKEQWLFTPKPTTNVLPDTPWQKAGLYGDEGLVPSSKAKDVNNIKIKWYNAI